jgi:hypothetical protein
MQRPYAVSLEHHNKKRRYRYRRLIEDRVAMLLD